MSLTGVCWTHSFGGRNPGRVIVAGSRVAFSYIADQGDAGAPGAERLVCLDLRGNERWSIRDFRLELALREEWLVGVTQRGELRVVDLDGRRCDGIRDGRKKAAHKEVREVQRRRDGLIVRTTTGVFVVDAALTVTDRFPTPRTDSLSVVADGVLMYVDRNRVMRTDRRGRTTIVCDLPTQMAHDTMTRWEQETGIAALDGVWMASWDPNDPDRDPEKAKGRLLGIGDRLPSSAWHVHYDDAAGSLFLVNHIQPHVVIALETDGHAKWCTYLSPHCCGGAPTSLANGELVVSSGCGGVVSWLNPTGHVLRRSTGWGMLNSNVRALRDSSSVVERSCLAHWADGTVRWVRSCHCFDYDEQQGRLVVANWATGENQVVTLTCIENPEWAHLDG